MEEAARKIIAKYVEDIHSLLTHGLQPISRQVDEPQMQRHPQAQALVRGFKATLERHLADVDGRMQELGTSPTTGVQDAAAAVAGVVAGVYNQVRTEAASKSIRDDYTYLSHLGIAYLMLHTTTKGLDDDRTAQIADRGYRDVARMVMEIDDVMPGLVLEELRQDNLPVKDVANLCHALIRDAWSHSQSLTSLGATEMGTTTGRT